MPNHGGHYQILGASYSPQLHTPYVQELEAELARCRSLVATRDAELDRLKGENSKLYKAYQEYRQANENLLREHNGLSRDLENSTNLSDARGKELASAQVFLSKADNISVIEVRDHVDALNEEIFQTAASLGDCVVRRRYDLSDEDQRSHRERLRPIVGKGLLRILSVTEPNGRNVNPLLVQVVAQVFLVDGCRHEIDRWDPSRSALSSCLKELYGGMRAVEQQSVFGRWRALTLAQIKPDFEGWRKDVLKNFKLLLEVACWDTSSPSHFDAFRNRLGTIFKTVQRLRRAIGLDIISEDYRIYAVLPDQPFMTIGMEEVYGDSEKRSSGEERIVLGTTALGLVKMNGPQYESGNCVVVPKVVVNTSFGDILTIPSSSRSSSAHHHHHDGRD